jgi:VanZ family protein
MTPHRLVQQIRAIALLVAALGVFLALGPFHVASPMDKLVHAGSFYGFTLLALGALPWHRRTDVAFAVLALAVASEVARGFCGRDASVDNVAADGLGVVLAAAPLWVARVRDLAQRHRFTTFSELRLRDRRRAARNIVTRRAGSGMDATLRA